jgi:hypothetical protein
MVKISCSELGKAFYFLNQPSRCYVSAMLADLLAINDMVSEVYFYCLNSSIGCFITSVSFPAFMKLFLSCYIYTCVCVSLVILSVIYIWLSS